MLPLRDHLSVATTALVLVIPVVIGVASGGLISGLVGIITGFLIYDYVFIPPYYTLEVGALQNWVALIVYVIVTLIVAQVVYQLRQARFEAQTRAEQTRRVFELSELAITNKSLEDLLNILVESVYNVFSPNGISLLLPTSNGLQVASTLGDPIQKSDIEKLNSNSGVPASLGNSTLGSGGLHVIVLIGSGNKPVGLLALKDLDVSNYDRDLLYTFVNHLALILEQAQLKDQALKANLLEQADKLRQSLLGAVSHDLRTPLTTITASATSIVEHKSYLSDDDILELATLISLESNRLNRLVDNLLDMTRIQSGNFQARQNVVVIDELIFQTVESLKSSGISNVTYLHTEEPLFVYVDEILIKQVLINLIENAARHNNSEEPVVIEIHRQNDSKLNIQVKDHGFGVSDADKEMIFQMFNSRSSGGRAGLGLAICKVFVEIHKERIWVEDNPSGGACFCFTVPLHLNSLEIDHDDKSINDMHGE